MHDNEPYTTPPCLLCRQPSVLMLDPVAVAAFKGGMHIQHAFPYLPPNERELIKTGTHPACWDAIFPEDDEDDAA